MSRPLLHIPRNADRFGENRSMGISTLRFKVAPEDSDGGSS